MSVDALFSADKEQWGGWLSCVRCGHPAAYHGMTFCQTRAGSDDKRICDCSGWFAWDPKARLDNVPATSTDGEVQP